MLGGSITYATQISCRKLEDAWCLGSECRAAGRGAQRDGCDAGCRLRIVANVIRGDIRQLPENVHFGLTINLPARFNTQYGLMFLQPACRMSLCNPTFRSANIH